MVDINYDIFDEFDEDLQVLGQINVILVFNGIEFE
jgi:hypothetical protein